MKEDLGFLKISSVVVKVAAWIFLFFGAVGSIYISSGRVSGASWIEGVINLAVVVFKFFILYIIAKILDLLIKIIPEIHDLKKTV